MLNYVVTPSWVYKKVSERPLASIVLQCLMFHRNTRTNRTHLMSKAEIAEKSNASRRRVYDVLAWLEEEGLIEQVAVRRGEYMYYLSCLGDIDSVESATDDRLTHEQRMAILWKEYEDA